MLSAELSPYAPKHHLHLTLFLLFSPSLWFSISSELLVTVYETLCRTAYDVTLNDDSWSRDVFDIVGGNTSMSWERLDA